MIISEVGNHQKPEDSQLLPSHRVCKGVQNGSCSRDGSVMGQNVTQKRRAGCSQLFRSEVFFVCVFCFFPVLLLGNYSGSKEVLGPDPCGRLAGRCTVH